MCFTPRSFSDDDAAFFWRAWFGPTLIHIVNVFQCPQALQVEVMMLVLPGPISIQVPTGIMQNIWVCHILPLPWTGKGFCPCPEVLPPLHRCQWRRRWPSVWPVAGHGTPSFPFLPLLLLLPSFWPPSIGVASNRDGGRHWRVLPQPHSFVTTPLALASSGSLQCATMYRPQKTVHAHTYLFILLRYLPLPHECRAHSFFSIFFLMPQRPAKSKQELSLDHSQRPIARCGPIQGEIDISPSRILLRLLRDTLLSRIGRAAPALGPSRC